MSSNTDQLTRERAAWSTRASYLQAGAMGYSHGARDRRVKNPTIDRLDELVRALLAPLSVGVVERGCPHPVPIEDHWWPVTVALYAPGAIACSRPTCWPVLGEEIHGTEEDNRCDVCGVLGDGVWPNMQRATTGITVLYGACDACHQAIQQSMMKVGRNDPCPCGSGVKYKRCCGMGGSG